MRVIGALSWFLPKGYTNAVSKEDGALLLNGKQGVRGISLLRLRLRDTHRDQ